MPTCITSALALTTLFPLRISILFASYHKLKLHAMRRVVATCGFSVGTVLQTADVSSPVSLRVRQRCSFEHLTRASDELVSNQMAPNSSSDLQKLPVRYACYFDLGTTDIRSAGSTGEGERGSWKCLIRPPELPEQETPRTRFTHDAPRCLLFIQ